MRPAFVAFRAKILLLTLLLFSVNLGVARAQLARSFYNVTAIQTRVLPNAVQVTIRTDGATLFGGDLNDFLDIEDDDFELKSFRTLRLRLVNARAKLPTLVNIGAYPVDAATVTLGTEPLQTPFFEEGGQEPFVTDPSVPRLDIELRFFVPVKMRRFVLGTSEGAGIDFGGALEPLEVEVRLGLDRRSIIITVLSDRVEAARDTNRLRRSPPNLQKRHLHIVPAVANGSPTGKLRIDALHVRLADFLEAVSRNAGVPLTTQADAAETDISLLLPGATLDETLETLRRGYGLAIVSRPATEGGGYLIGRSGGASVTERVPLKYLSPDTARLLFPDFLLPYMRTDRENNALIVAGPEALVARIRQDVAKLDLPRPQVLVQAQAYEISRGDDLVVALQAAYRRGPESEAINSAASTFTVLLEKGQKTEISAQLEALRVQGRARYSAQPSLLIASGATGTLFQGQTRFVQVLRRNQNGQQSVQALKVPVGTTLTATPSVGTNGGDVTLALSTRFATVDAIEQGTGLPTLGTREVSGTVRVHPGDAAMIVGGLESDLSSRVRRRSPFAFLPIIGKALDWVLSPFLHYRRESASRTAFIVLITAQVAGGAPAGKENTPPL